MPMPMPVQMSMLLISPALLKPSCAVYVGIPTAVSAF
jgi:hypothetical protein